VNGVYYKSPTAAAFMMLYHGVMFVGEGGETVTADHLHLKVFQEGRYQIHPDSMELFDARKGDLVLLANGMEAYRYSTPVKLTRGERIVMRNNQPFHWPEADPQP